MTGAPDWPQDAVLHVAPYHPNLHAPGTVSSRGHCTWGDDRKPARWSVLWHGQRWACCDDHLAGFARAQLLNHPGPAEADK